MNNLALLLSFVVIGVLILLLISRNRDNFVENLEGAPLNGNANINRGVKKDTSLLGGLKNMVNSLMGGSESESKNSMTSSQPCIDVSCAVSGGGPRPGSVYAMNIMNERAEKPTTVVRLLYTDNCYAHPLIGVFHAVRDMVKDQYDGIEFEMIAVSRLDSKNYVDATNQNRRGDLMYEPYPRIIKMDGTGKVSTYDGYTNPGQLFDWVMNYGIKDTTYPV